MLNVNEKKKEKTTVEVGTIGEKIAAAFLKGKGYDTNVDTKLPGSTDIEATSKGASLLVQVKTGVEPNEPANLSAEEEGAIKRRAGQKDWQAWEARVQLTKDYSQKGDIKWRRLDEPEKKKS